MFLSAIVYPHSPHSLEVEAFKVRRKRSQGELRSWHAALRERDATGLFPAVWCTYIQLNIANLCCCEETVRVSTTGESQTSDVAKDGSP